MDPLSIATAGIAFAGATSQLAKCIQRLRAIRQAPLEMKLLLEEVLDLNGLLDQLEPTQTQTLNIENTRNTRNINGSEKITGGAGLEWHISRTSSKLKELDSLLQEHASKPARFGVNHLTWSKTRQRANALREDLKVLRLNLSASLGANTS